jgi:DNA-binding MarR family transcriptional regulator
LYDYLVMAALSEAPDRALRLSELATVTNASLPRLSQVVTKLQRRGWIKRRPDPDDRRTTLAVMTADGMKMLVKAAPAHVEQVRKLVFDSLTNAQVRQLSEISRRIRKTIGPLYENSNQVAGDR